MTRLDLVLSKFYIHRLPMAIAMNSTHESPFINFKNLTRIFVQESQKKLTCNIWRRPYHRHNLREILVTDAFLLALLYFYGRPSRSSFRNLVSSFFPLLPILLISKLKRCKNLMQCEIEWKGDNSRFLEQWIQAKSIE